MASSGEQSSEYLEISIPISAEIWSQPEQWWWMCPVARFFGHALYGECIIMLSNIA